MKFSGIFHISPVGALVKFNSDRLSVSGGWKNILQLHANEAVGKCQYRIFRNIEKLFKNIITVNRNILELVTAYPLSITNLQMQQKQMTHIQKCCPGIRSMQLLQLPCLQTRAYNIILLIYNNNNSKQAPLCRGTCDQRVLCNTNYLRHDITRRFSKKMRHGMH